MKLRRMVSGMMALLLVAGMPLAAFAEEYDLATGSISVTANEGGQYVTQENGVTNEQQTTPTVITQSNSETSNTITIKAEENATANVTIQDVNIVNSDPTDAPPVDHSGEAAVTIDVEDGAKANVTLDGVNIDTKNTGGLSFNPEIGDSDLFSGEAAVQIKGNGDVTLELDGENTVQGGFNHAGVEKNTTDDSGKGELTITDETGTSGSLEATGGSGGSGIGGGYMSTGSSITIKGSAEVTAQGGDFGSGIGGGGGDGSGSNITITGSAKVTAQGGDYGSGIGGGSGGSGSVITITGNANVDATGGIGGSGIGGGGSGGSGSNITIEGSAEVTATGGEYGSGIGGGVFGSGSDITIQGSTEVTAQGGTGGSGIGGGRESTGSENITVSDDAQVKAQGGEKSVQSNWLYKGAGAAIGEGGKAKDGSEADPGDEVTPITDALNEGWIATYAPGATGLDTADPNTLTYKGKNGVTTSTNVKFVPAKDPTCEDDGNTAGFQTESDQIDIVTIPATDHSFTNYIPDGKATCTADDTKTAHCDHAGCDKKDTIPDPGTMLKHELGKYYTDTPATCQKEGVERRDCANCTYSETRPIDKLKHSFTNYISDNNATYEADGTKTAKCDHCDATDTISDPGSKLVRKEAPQTAPLYRVIGQDGKALACKEARSSGVLTITVDADFATLTGSVSGLKTLKAQGVDTIVFVTNGATSTFALSDLLAQGGGTYALTHDSQTVTFTLSNGTDIGKILK